MNSPSFDQLPDSLLTDILSRASGISQQQEQQQEHQAQHDQEQALAVSTRQQQRHLCGIFTHVNHRWRLAALNICTRLHVALKDLSAVKQLSSWLRRNGNQLQHLSLDLSTSKVPASFFSLIPSSTPQLQSLKLRGLSGLTSNISSDDTAAWGGLTGLTSLDVDSLKAFDAPMQYLEHVQDLSVSGTSTYQAGEACVAVEFKLPQLRVLRVQGPGVCYPITRQALDILSGKQHLQQVEGVSVCAEDLDHSAVSLIHPSMRINLRKASCHIHQVEGWLEEGGGKQLVQLVLECSRHPCSIVLDKLQGLPMLRSLELYHASLEAAAQQVFQLTQITGLVLEGCGPPLSLAELPQQLVRLSIDNISEQLGQHSSSTTLQQLTSLTLVGSCITDATMRGVSSLPQLQDLTLLRTVRVALSRGLASLQELHSLTSLRLSNPMLRSLGSVGYSVLSGISSLRRFALTDREPAVTALGLAQALEHVPLIQLLIGDWGHHEKVAGGSLEVRHSI